MSLQILLILSVLIARGYCELNKFPIHYYPSHADGHTLRNGKEIVVHLKQKETKRYMYQVKEAGSKVHMVVTPCGVAIRWKLTQQLDERINGDSEESSGDFLGGGDFSTVDDGPTDSNGLSSMGNKFTSDKSKNSLKQKAAKSLKNLTNQPNLLKKEGVLVKEVGVTQMKYFGDNMPAGFLHFYITSEENSTSARIFVSSAAGLSHFFPKLPPNKRVEITNITTNSVEFQWDQSTLEDQFKKGDVDYCLVLSDTHDYNSYCEVNSEINFDLQGQHDSERLKTKVNRFSDLIFGLNELSRERNTSKPRQICIKYKTAYIFDELQGDSKFYLNIFAINTHTGGSVAYFGASFFLRKEKSLERFTLKDNQMIASYLNPSRAAFKLYRFPVKQFHRAVLLTIQPCSGTLRVQISKDGHSFKRAVFEELKIFIFESVAPGVIEIKVSNDDNDAKKYRIFASVHTYNNPYPKMPQDTSIKVLEHSRTCNSVTLAWLLTNERHQYCLYKRMEEDDYFKKLILEESDQCFGPESQPDMTEVSCSTLKPETDDDLIHNATVTDLKPSTTYRFDLFAKKTKHNGKHMSYRTVWVKTRANCTAADTVNN